MNRTSSKAPLVLGIVGGVLGIIGGACATCAIGDPTVEELVANYALGAWMILIGSALGLVGGCCAKSQKWGSLLALLAGIVVFIGTAISCTVLLIFPIAAAILLVIAGAIGMAKKA